MPPTRRERRESRSDAVTERVASAWKRYLHCEPGCPVCALALDSGASKGLSKRRIEDAR